jgi:hypothetical protein
MQLTIHGDERVEIVLLDDGYRRVIIWDGEQRRLTADTLSKSIVFVVGEVT